MATIVTSVSDIVRAYNLKNIRTINATQNNPYTGKISANAAADKQLYLSSLGTPVFTDLTLLSGYYPDPDGGDPIPFPEIKFVTVLMTIEQAKNIVRTQIQGSNGTIKEYIGLDDYQITINGIIPGSNNHYPLNEVRALHLVNTAPVALHVVSTYLQNLDIDYLVINRFSYNQEAGGYSQQPFTINAFSAQDVDLIITTGKTGNAFVGSQNQAY